LENLLFKALAYRRKNIAIAREIRDNANLEQLPKKFSYEPNPENFKINFECRWWLDKLFQRARLSFAQGTILIYALAMIPRVLVLPIVLHSGITDFQIAYFASYFGDLVILLGFLLIDFIHNGLRNLAEYINKSLVNRFIMPPCLIQDENISSSEKIKELDDKYKTYYVNPIVGRTLQLGFDLSFNKCYQIGSGAISTGVFAVILVLRYGFNLIPENVFAVWTPIPQIAQMWTVYAWFIIGFAWFVVGMMAWTLFITFLIVIQTSGNPIRIRSYESLKELFQPLTTLMLKTTLSIALIAAWFSPYMLAWSVASSQAVREGVYLFLEAVLIVSITTIVFSLVVPLIKIHKGMDESRDRALLLKSQQLEDLRKKPPENFNYRMRVQNHLMEDYTRIRMESEWALNSGQFLQIFGTVLFPIATFLLSRL
jgi:hypothetical protein